MQTWWQPETEAPPPNTILGTISVGYQQDELYENSELFDYPCAIIDHDHTPLFLRQFLNPSKVEEYLQLVEKTQGVEFRFCNLVLADREEVALPVDV